jgi:hypothetical protein
MKSIFLALGCFFTLALVSHNSGAHAQSTLFNIPSTDVVAKGKVYAEFDFVSHLESHDDGGFQTYVPRLVVGAGKGVEFGVNLSVTDVGSDTPVEFQPNVKYQFYSNEKNGVAAAAGGILYLPAHDKAAFSNDQFGLLYTVVSKKVNSKYGPRLTGGAYGLVGRADGTGTKGGAIAGYEQPLHPKVSFVADWFSGKNRFGYVTPGFSFAVSKSSYFYAGYSIGNQGRKNNALFLYYGITF